MEDTNGIPGETDFVDDDRYRDCVFRRTQPASAYARTGRCCRLTCKRRSREPLSRRIQRSDDTAGIRGLSVPPCATYNPVIKSVLQHYGDKLRLEFRQFPLAGVHPNAVEAALAAEAAGEQGRYWEMNDLLFETQPQWALAANPDENFTALAARIGLDEVQFLKALHSADLQRRISADVASAQAAHVEGTPTFFLNGRHIDVPAVTLEAFQKTIDPELQRNR